MTKRRKMVVANWKMNKEYIEGLVLANTIIAGLEKFSAAVDIVLCPPFIHIQTVYNMLKEYPWLHVGAQNCHQLKTGAFTGEVSASMLKSVGAEYIIVGHSERRDYFNEQPELLLQKTKTIIEAGLFPIYCFGEKLEIRETGKHEAFVIEQLQNLFTLPEVDFKKVVLAYEPVWAIGTGVVATTEQAQSMHALLRNHIAQKYSLETALETIILYGGSCNAINSADLFAQPDIDGALVGSASLNPNDFLEIVKNRAAATKL
jgi:triosephosphate isomerase